MLHLCWAKSSSCQNHTWLVRWQHMLLCSQYDATARPVLGSEATYMYKTGSLQLVVITREFRNTGYNTSPQSNEMWHTRLSNNCRCPLKGPICNGCQRWSVVCRSSAVCCPSVGHVSNTKQFMLSMERSAEVVITDSVAAFRPDQTHPREMVWLQMLKNMSILDNNCQLSVTVVSSLVL